MTSRACLSVTLSIAVMPANIPLSSHLVDDCSSGSQYTGAAPRWISVLVIIPVWIARDQPAEPWPPLAEPSEEIIAVLLSMAVVKSTAWSPQSTGAAPCWISVLVIIPVWIARDQPVEPWPPLTEPSEDIIAVLLAMAVVKSTAWSAVGHSV